MKKGAAPTVAAQTGQMAASVESSKTKALRSLPTDNAAPSRGDDSRESCRLSVEHKSRGIDDHGAKGRG